MTDASEKATGTEPSWLDDTLRAALNHIPDDGAVTGLPPVEVLDEIDRAIGDGWPQGRPPTLDELASDAGDSADPPGGLGVPHGDGWSDVGVGEVVDPGHQHNWHHHDDHCGDSDPAAGPYL